MEFSKKRKFQKFLSLALVLTLFFTLYGGPLPNLLNSFRKTKSALASDTNAISFLFKFGSRGNGNGQFKYPMGIATNSAEDIIVADTCNYRIQVFDKDGNFKFKFGSRGSLDGQFKYPVEVATNSFDDIIVADPDTYRRTPRIQVFDKNGEFKFKFGSCGTGNGQFKWPVGVTTNSFNDIIVADWWYDWSYSGSIQVFSKEGDFKFKINIKKPVSVTTNSFDDIIVLCDYGGFYVFDKNGNFKFQAGTGFKRPLSVATDSFDNIIVADTGNYRIQAFDKNGNFKFKFGSWGSGDMQFGCPNSVATNSFDDIIVVDKMNHRIQVFAQKLSFYVSPSTFGTPPYTGFTEEPINTSTGNYIYQKVDISIPSKPNLEFARNYNSFDEYSGPLGVGWTHTYNLNLSFENETAVVVKEDGRRDYFEKQSDGTYKASLGIFSTLTKNADGTYILKEKDKTEFSFSEEGKLISIADKNSNVTNLIYEDNLLKTVTDFFGRSLIFTHNSDGHIIKVTDPADGEITYAYDDIDNLILATDQEGNITTYTYDDNHRMTSYIEPKGNIFITNTYDEEGRVVEQVNALGEKTGLILILCW